MVLTRRSASSEPMLSPEEESRLLEAWNKHRDVAARDRLVRAYARICYSVASRYARNPAHVEDLAQEGFFGIIRALERFDPERGTRFSGYARLWVQNFIAAAVARVSAVVDVPSRTFVDVRSGRVAEGANNAAIAASMGVISLDEDLEGQTEFNKLICSRPTPEDISANASRNRYFRSCLEQAMQQLTDRERDVITRRALADTRETLEEIAAGHGVTRERIRQIEKTALLKMRDALESKGFDPAILS